MVSSSLSRRFLYASNPKGESTFLRHETWYGTMAALACHERTS